MVKVKNRRGQDLSFQIPATSPSDAREIQNKLIADPTSHRILAQELARRAVGIVTEAQSVVTNSRQVVVGRDGKREHIKDRALDADVAWYQVDAFNTGGRRTASESFGAFGAALSFIRNSNWLPGIEVALTTNAVETHCHKVLPMAKARRIHAGLTAQKTGADLG